MLSQEQRITWIRTVLTQPVESSSYRLAALLLLLYAQPLTRIAALRADDVLDAGGSVLLRLGHDLALVPEPFAALLREHLAARPNLRYAKDSPWLFPSTTPGRHINANTVMEHVRGLGINLLGARNAALRDLVTQAPAPVVADMLGYSFQVTARHASLAGIPTAAYAASLQPRTPSKISGHSYIIDATDGRVFEKSQVPVGAVPDGHTPLPSVLGTPTDLTAI